MQLRTLLATLAFSTVCSLPIAYSQGAAEASNGNNAAPSRSTASTVEQVPALSATLLRIPTNFTAYAAQSIGRGMFCHVGAVTGDDGMNQKPVAYAQDAKGKKILWVKQLELPSDTFQSRATHCTSFGTSVFVLLQSDTQSEQTLSQTLLRVVKLDADTGTVITQHNVDVPKSYSAWVDEGVPHFQWQGNALLITGNYRPSSDDADPIPFTVHLSNDLKQ